MSDIITKTINGKEILFVQVPADAQLFKFDASWELAYVQRPLGFRNRKPILKFNPNNYKILGKASELNDEQWSNVLVYYDGTEDENIGGMIYECFDNSDFVCDTGTASGLSLISSLRLKPETTLLIEKK